MRNMIASLMSAFLTTHSRRFPLLHRGLGVTLHRLQLRPHREYSIVVGVGSETRMVSSWSAVPPSLASTATSSSASASSFTGRRGSPEHSMQEIQLVQDILHRIRDVNRMTDEIRSTAVPFYVDGKRLGLTTPETAQLLCDTTDREGRFVFRITTTNDELGSVGEIIGRNHLTFAATVGTSFEERSQAVDAVMSKLRDDGIIQGWRDEAYAVATGFYDEPVFQMERSAVSYLGVLEYGVHVNGLVRTNDGEGKSYDRDRVEMWIGRRSRQKSKYPGMLDHIVAGGQPAGISLLDNVIKECMEEAGIPESMARAGLRPVGAISYETYSQKSNTISRAVIFNYDLMLPPDFVPKPHDGEVEEFFRWSIGEILQSMAVDYPDPIKPNCYLVIIDYLVREGHLSPDIPGYLDIVRELRSGDCR